MGTDDGRAVGLAVFLVDVDQVDVGRHVELVRAQLAHADDPEVDAPAGVVQRRAVAGVLVGQGLGQRPLERGFGQVGHREGDVLHRRVLLDVEHGQALEHELARHPQRARQRTAALFQAIDQREDAVAVRQAGRQQGQFGGETTAHPLHKATVRGGCQVGRRRRCGFDRNTNG